MSDAQQQTIFQEFRKHENNVGVTSGAGVGLINSKILAEASGGSISLRSRLGEFTEVTFTVDAPEVAANLEAGES